MDEQLCSLVPRTEMLHTCDPSRAPRPQKVKILEQSLELNAFKYPEVITSVLDQIEWLPF